MQDDSHDNEKWIVKSNLIWNKIEFQIVNVDMKNFFPSAKPK